ncbi:thioredoxin family protein [Viridibacterium curvum]|uniref:Thioredoxin domain-containing protein n=1 Tax=Viridibacterium curvum TaxID=1101404 RepID=A0ABP9QVN3_9RHOO
MSSSSLFVACLCAEWCGSCREYRPAFDALAVRMPGVEFAWVDIEDEPEIAGDINVENFPTIVIQRGESVMFCGAMLPHVTQLERLIQTYSEPGASGPSASTQSAMQQIANVRERIRQR